MSVLPTTVARRIVSRLWIEPLVGHDNFGILLGESGHGDSGRMVFGIVQGSRFEDLRRRSAEDLIELDFPGYAVGGVSVGEPEPEMLAQVEYTAGLLPVNRPAM